MKREPYGSWQSPIDAEVAVASVKGYGSLRGEGDDLYWTEARPSEGGRTTLVRYADGESRELTPAPFHPRSRVHEYGGGAYCVAGEHAFFVNFADQNIYRVAVDGLSAPRAITAGDANERFGDLAWDGDALLAVRETHGDAEPVNDLVRVDVDTGSVTVVHAGHDFYAAPRPAHGRLAFLVWDHPNMPWDGTQLVVADYRRGALTNATVVAGGAAESVVQPTWCRERLLFATDAGGYWNLHAYDDSGVYCVLEEAAEYAGPAWQFGTAYFAVVGEHHVVARRVADGVASLVLVDIERGFATPLHDACSSYGDLAHSARGIAYISGYADRSSRIVELGLDTREERVIAAPAPSSIPQAVISAPERIDFPTEGGTAHAFIYPPRNGDKQGLVGELPPLLVTTHGGPTASATADLSWGVQFYTSRGWAVADVNYRGSTGYGRPYREQLRGRWGLADVQDCVACVRHLVAEGRVDASRVAIRGGSAGGYTTLAALTFSSVFKAGASHYGIGDLKALDEDTHKFESRYVGTLVGDSEAIRDRSPINHVHRLDCPVIFFQGADDKVVPPNQAEAMRDALLAKGVDVEYELFEGEGHGFRRAENVRRVINAEYAFFARVFGIAL